MHMPVTILSKPAPLVIKLPTRARLLDETRAAYDEGRDVLWSASRDAPIPRAVDTLTDWRPAHLSVFADGEQRFAWLAHDASAPVSYFTTPTSWFRTCRMCGWIDGTRAWSDVDERVAYDEAGAFACGAGGCLSRVHDWVKKRHRSVAPHGDDRVELEPGGRARSDLDTH